MNLDLMFYTFILNNWFLIKIDKFYLDCAKRDIDLIVIILYLINIGLVRRNSTNCGTCRIVI